MRPMNRNGKNQATRAPFEPDYLEGQEPPPPPDEAYWAALLSDGDRAPEALSAAPGPDADAADGWRGRAAHGRVAPIRAEEAPGAADGLPYLAEPAIGNGHAVSAMTAAHGSGVGADAGHGASQDWDESEAVFAEDRTVSLRAVSFNRGGLLVEWNSLRGFVPASQLINAPAAPNRQGYRQHMATYLHHPLTLRIIELDRHTNRLILSERAAQVRPGSRASIMDTLRPGDVVIGRVTNLADFGAFIDLGGVEGLVHISELSWGRVSHPRDLLRRGEEVHVHVMEVHREAGRVALSIKRLQPDPWKDIESRYQIGQIIEGVITNIVDFGAFASVEDGLEGLIHVSELAEGHFLHPRNVVNEGDRIAARILNIDGRARRLGLSLREVSDQPRRAANGSPPPSRAD